MRFKVYDHDDEVEDWVTLTTEAGDIALAFNHDGFNLSLLMRKETADARQKTEQDMAAAIEKRAREQAAAEAAKEAARQKRRERQQSGAAKNKRRKKPDKW